MRNVSYAQAVTQGIKKNMVGQENRAVHSDNKTKFKAMGLNIYLGISLFMNSVGPFGLSGMGLSYRIFRPKVLGPVRQYGGIFNFLLLPLLLSSLVLLTTSIPSFLLSTGSLGGKLLCSVFTCSVKIATFSFTCFNMLFLFTVF